MRRARQLLRAASLVAMLTLFGSLSASAEPAWTKNPTRVDKGEVEISLTPIGIANGRFRIAVSVNSHSGNLSKLDLQHNTALRVGKSTYKALGPVRLSGHHGEGHLEFPLPSVPDEFEIEISNGPAGKNRLFRWP